GVLRCLIGDHAGGDAADGQKLGARGTGRPLCQKVDDGDPGLEGIAARRAPEGAAGDGAHQFLPPARVAFAALAAAWMSSIVTCPGFIAVCGVLAMALATIFRIARPSRPTQARAHCSNCGARMSLPIAG